MSFSSDIKEIICRTEYECPECRLAELAGFFVFPGKLGDDNVKLKATVPKVKERIAAALKSELDIDAEEGSISADDSAKLKAKLSGFRTENECCRLAYIRGAFLGGGSVSDPAKEYHLEFATRSDEDAVEFISLLEQFGFRPKRTMRRGKYVVYIKESEQIAEIIGYLTGGRAGLEIFSLRIERSVKGEIQRQVNCDSANLNKQAMASAKHVKAIKKIKAARKWSALPDVLREIGELRLKYPDAGLEELGTMTKQGIGKSGVNHRLNRIMEFAGGLTAKGE